MTSSNSNYLDKAQLSYHDAGVDIELGDHLINIIKPLAQGTMRPEVLSGIGGFGGLFEISQKYQNPVLVSSTDGVGTKLKLALHLNRHDSIGIDLVAMSVNDILVQGAEPLFFLDYFACGKLNVETATAVIGGIARGCEQAGCALIGGETAEMPGMYSQDEYDVAGFSVGIVEKDRIISGNTIQEGDIVLGLASSGAHSNGYSLIRKIIEDNQIDLSAGFDGKTLADTLMIPTRIYVKSLLTLIRQLPIKGLAHITGGGLIGNVPRILPERAMAVLYKNTWKMPPLFHWLQQQGNIADHEMMRVFNCGIGIVIVLASEYVEDAMHSLHASGEVVWKIGHIKQRLTNESSTVLV